MLYYVILKNEWKSINALQFFVSLTICTYLKKVCVLWQNSLSHCWAKKLRYCTNMYMCFYSYAYKYMSMEFSPSLSCVSYDFPYFPLLMEIFHKIPPLVRSFQKNSSDTHKLKQTHRREHLIFLGNGPHVQLSRSLSLDRSLSPVLLWDNQLQGAN